MAPKLSDTEPVSLAVMQALLGFTSEARWIRHAGTHHLFPYLPQQPGYNTRLRAAADAIRSVIGALVRDSALLTDDAWVADSTPVEPPLNPSGSIRSPARDAPRGHHLPDRLRARPAGRARSGPAGGGLMTGLPAPAGEHRTVLAGVKANALRGPTASPDTSCRRRRSAAAGSGLEDTTTDQDPPNSCLYGSGDCRRTSSAMRNG